MHQWLCLQQMHRQQNQKAAKLIVGGYELGKKIGTGTFATVKEATHLKTNQKVAAKILRKRLIVDTQDKINLSRELRILQKLRHPNIVQLLEILQNSSKIYLMMEHVQGGELYDLIVKSDKNRLEEDMAASFFQQLIGTVQYLHSLGVAHRDIKPENILIANGNLIKLIDFGLSNLYQPKEKLATACGSPCYAAPEMLSQKSYDPLKVDLWSCGIVLYTMLVGYLPFQHDDTTEVYNLVRRGEYDVPEHLSKEAKDILKKLLEVSPEKRLSIEEMRAHPFCSNRPQPIIKGLLPNERISVDLDLVQELKDLGYSGFVKDLQDNRLTPATAAFYLLLKKKLAQKSITSSTYYQKIQKKQPFRSRSITLKKYTQKNPEELPSISNKNINSLHNLNHRSAIISQIRKRAQSNNNILSLRIKRVK